MKKLTVLIIFICLLSLTGISADQESSLNAQTIQCDPANELCLADGCEWMGEVSKEGHFTFYPGGYYCPGKIKPQNITINGFPLIEFTVIRNGDTLAIKSKN